MRIITCSKYNAHTSPIFKDLSLLKLDDIFKLSLLKFHYKLVNNLLPTYFPGMFVLNNLTHTYGTRYRDVDRPPIARTVSADNSVRHYMPIFLESIPYNIREKVQTHCLKGFNKYVKMYYISEYTSECLILDCYICNSE